jgi:Trypsin-like peptidase domain
MKQIFMWPLLLLTLLLMLDLSASRAEEGFFEPDKIVTPFDKSRILRSIVRIRTHLYWDAVVFASDADASTFRQSCRNYPGSGLKTYLPEGVVLWHVVLTKDDLGKIRADLGQSETPGLFEIVRAFDGVSTFPTEKIVPLQGCATGFFISKDGQFITNYHVVREEIEANARTAGSHHAVVCRFTSFEVPVLDHGEIIDWRRLKNVTLVKDLSENEWRDGFDGALLQTDETPQAYLKIARQEPPVNDEVWHFGFPMRTHRDPEQLRKKDYEDADGGLRVSAGRITEIKDHNFLSDADSFSGSSGSPAVSRTGELLGYVWNVYPDDEANRRANDFRGGTIYVSALAIAKKLGIL